MSSPSPVVGVRIRERGPRENSVQCVITRDKSTSTYRLCLDSQALRIGEDVPEGEFLLAARKLRCATGTKFIICSNADDLSSRSSSCVGKLRSNFLGSKFTVSDTQQPHNGAVSDSSGSRWWRTADKNSTTGLYNVAHIVYHVNVLGPSGPRRLHCTLPNIPASAMAPNGAAPTPTDFPAAAFTGEDPAARCGCIPPSKSKSAVADFDSMTSELLTRPGPLVLKINTPRWHEQLRCWCLNFGGRVTIASVKNFQLVAATGPSRVAAVLTGNSQVLLQFGKVGNDRFTMDYRYPLSALQAFAICLSSFDKKLVDFK